MDEHNNDQLNKQVDGLSHGPKDSPELQQNSADAGARESGESRGESVDALMDPRRIDIEEIHEERRQDKRVQKAHKKHAKRFQSGSEKTIQPGGRVKTIQPGRGKKRLKWILLALVVLVVGGGVAAGAYFYNFAQETIIDTNSEVGFIEQVRRVVDEEVEPLKGEEDDRINVLLMGQGGLDHPGGTLVDTIMIASIKPSTNEVAFLSIPRDFVIPYYRTEDTAYPEYRKINYMMYLGGAEFAYETIELVTGLEVHYHILVDFAAFRDVIDTLGGVDVAVENAFTDYQYPDYNYGWQTISFEEGVQTMDGETALQFSRSRHGNNGEGSDFARAKRQQLVMEAVRNKTLSASTLLNPTKMTGLLNDLGDNVSMNLEIWELLRFAKMAEDIDTSGIVSHVIDNSEDGLLNSEISSETGAYVLLPRAGLDDYSEIQELALNVFEAPQPVVNEETEAVAVETATIVVQNASGLNGLASSVQEVLQEQGIGVKTIGNALVSDRADTMIYDLSSGEKPETAAALAEHFGIELTTATLPANPDSSVRLGTDINTAIVDVSQITEGVDFIVILGKDRLGTTAAITNNTRS